MYIPGLLAVLCIATKIPKYTFLFKQNFQTKLPLAELCLCKEQSGTPLTCSEMS